MDEEIITIFCLCDDLLKLQGVSDDVRSKMSHAEILTIGYMAVRYFGGNYRSAHKFFMSMHPSYPLDYSRFIRRINALHYVIDTLFYTLGQIFKKLDTCLVYSVDSFPVDICKLERSQQCNLYSHSNMKGYNASKNSFFYGFKVHMVITTNKEPICCYISYGNEHDVVAAKKYLPDISNNALVIGDKGYISKDTQHFLSTLGITLNPIYRSNMDTPHQQDEDYRLKRKIRKQVETVFSVITSRFGKTIKATSIDGFLTKLKLFITAYSLECFLKKNVEL
jgi:hypothetical protein